jgi:hypothetical protein
MKETGMSKLFVRERRQVGEGVGQPRFRIVATVALDVQIYVPHMRRMELEQLAAATGAEIVYLERDEQEEPRRFGRGGGVRRGRGQGRRMGRPSQAEE